MVESCVRDFRPKQIQGLEFLQGFERGESGVGDRAAREAKFLKICETAECGCVSVGEFLPGKIQIHCGHRSFEKRENRGIDFFRPSEIYVTPVDTGGEGLHQNALLSECGVRLQFFCRRGGTWVGCGFTKRGGSEEHCEQWDKKGRWEEAFHNCPLGLVPIAAASILSLRILRASLDFCRMSVWVGR